MSTKGQGRARGGGLTHIGEFFSPELIKKIKGPTPIQKRLAAAAAAHIENPEDQSVLYQHSVLCQTYLPYRNPGDDKREWQRLNGGVHLKVRAGETMHPQEHRLVQLGLPYGPKCRLVLMHINQLAILSQSPRIEVADSLTAFVRRVLHLDPKGRNIELVKAQLARLAAADMTLGIGRSDATGAATGATTNYLRVVDQFDVWLTKDERQRVLWPSTIDLSEKYFTSLINFAVPLNETHIAALSHTALGLDIYAWLAQRLHRIPLNKPAFVSWAALHAQFGQGYESRVRKFRQDFKVALKQVVALYKEARITEDQRQPPRLFLQDGNPVWRERPAKGLTLYHSRPPVPYRLQAVSAKSE